MYGPEPRSPPAALGEGRTDRPALRTLREQEQHSLLGCDSRRTVVTSTPGFYWSFPPGAGRVLCLLSHSTGSTHGAEHRPRPGEPAPQTGGWTRAAGRGGPGRQTPCPGASRSRSPEARRPGRRIQGLRECSPRAWGRHVGVSRSRDGFDQQGSRTNLKDISAQRGAPRTTTAPRPGARSSKASVWLREAQARPRRLTLCLSHALSPAGGSAPPPGLEARQRVLPGRCAGWGTPAAEPTGPARSHRGALSAARAPDLSTAVVLGPTVVSRVPGGPHSGSARLGSEISGSPEAPRFSWEAGRAGYPGPPARAQHGSAADSSVSSRGRRGCPFLVLRARSPLLTL